MRALTQAYVCTYIYVCMLAFMYAYNYECEVAFNSRAPAW